uniref:Uncharacterized protein n=1 Tax=Anguilla anguilla TaxID=7936 RepID=A0A0E9V1S6_ANGAN
MKLKNRTEIKSASLPSCLKCQFSRRITGLYAPGNDLLYRLFSMLVF